MTQRQALYKAWDLARINTNAEIHILVESDEVLPDYGWTGHKIARVELGLWAEYDDRIITDKDMMRDELENYYGRDVTYEEAHSWMREAILIYTRAG